MIVLVIFVISSNKGELVFLFQKYENKIRFQPDSYIEVSIDSEQYLKDIIVGVPYIGTLSREYIPTNIDNEGEKEEYLRNIAKDENYVYKKNIDWSSGEITGDELKELVELIGYHLNKYSSDTVIVQVPSVEQLDEYGEEVIFYTDNNGILYINLYVEEINTSTDIKKEYYFTYRLEYDMYGKIIIR